LYSVVFMDWGQAEHVFSPVRRWLTKIGIANRDIIQQKSREQQKSEKIPNEA